jgi:hypothetical protein
MKTLVAFELADGQRVVAEVDEPGDEDEVLQRVSRFSRGSDLVVDSGKKLDEVSDVIVPTAERMHRAVSGMDVVPDEIELELGVKLTLSAGAVIASTGLEGNIRVLLRWKVPPP